MPAPISHLPAQDSVKAAAYMAIAMAAFPCNDTIMKLLSSELPVGTLIFVRGLFSTSILLAAITWKGEVTALGQALKPTVAIRALIDTIATVLFISALVRMPIANITSISQTVPLIATAIAALFLKERVGWRRTTAILCGFAGVVLIVKPDVRNLDSGALLALWLVLCLAIRDILTRYIHGSIPALVVAFANSVFVLAGAAVFSVSEGGIAIPNLVQTLSLAAAGGFLALGYLFMVMTLRYADVSTSAPVRYSVVLWSLISGVVVFGDFPDRIALGGIILVVLSGLYTLHRERILAGSRGS